MSTFPCPDGRRFRIASGLLLFILVMCAACNSSGRAKTDSGTVAGTRQTAPNAAASDLPGVTPASDLLGGSAPLTSADVQFYLRIMQAAVARYQHPTARDRAALAQAPLIIGREAASAKRMAAGMKAGRYQQAMAGVYHPSPGEKALKDRYGILSMEGADVLIASRQHMPDRQWDALKTTVEMAAHAGVFSVRGGNGGGEHNAVLTSEQILHGKQQKAIMDKNEKFVAPWGGQIRQLASQETGARMQDLRTSMSGR